MKFSKYELNLMKADALKDVGEAIESNIRWDKDSLDSSNQELEEFRRRIAEGEEGLEWRVETAERYIKRMKIKLEMWDIAQAALDKELMF